MDDVERVAQVESVAGQAGTGGVVLAEDAGQLDVGF